MGFLEFGIFCLVVCAIAWVVVYVLGLLLPGHPGMVDRIIWGVAVLIIVLKLLAATGLMSHDPEIPHF